MDHNLPIQDPNGLAGLQQRIMYAQALRLQLVAAKNSSTHWKKAYDDQVAELTRLDAILDDLTAELEDASRGEKVLLQQINRLKHKNRHLVQQLEGLGAHVSGEYVHSESEREEDDRLFVVENEQHEVNLYCKFTAHSNFVHTLRIVILCTFAHCTLYPLV